MSENELEEFRYDVAHALLSRMSKGSQFQYALDKVVESISDATEQELCEMAPDVVVVVKKPKNKSKSGTGF
jgi:hypothetical protein|tara:strand:+ start:153 stop:365 length:213 start_codon:yes stop_codon:yes gene_type:complete